MVASDFTWLTDGPIQRFYRDQVQPEFLASSFSGPGEFRVFRSGMLSRHSNPELIGKLKHLSREFQEMCVDDESIPLSDRFGTSLLMALRPWGVSAFESLRKVNVKTF